MRTRLKQKTSLIFLAGIVLGWLASCGATPAGSFRYADYITSYRDIPEISSEELEAIEKLKSSRRSFSLGTLPSADAFILPDGADAGFSALFCELLSGFFEVPFVREIHSGESLESNIDNGVLDFALTHEQRASVFNSHPVAEHSAAVFTLGESVKIDSASDLNGLTIGFSENLSVIKLVLSAYPHLDFTPSVVEEAEILKALEAGTIDAFIADTTAFAGLADNPLVISHDILPLVKIPVLFSALKPELEPVISALNKYIDSGGDTRLFELYRNGSREYTRFRFINSLSDEEAAYINELSANGLKVSAAFEYDNYPISFYDESAGEYQGIAVDVLSGISDLAGIEFHITTDKNTPWPSILEDLVLEKVSMVSELLYTEERKNDFLWSGPYAVSHYALLSKSDRPQIDPRQVPRMKVGVGKDSAYEDMYDYYFADNSNVTGYASEKEAVDALKEGEIDLFMAPENMLLSIRRYSESSGYKVNLRFDTPRKESFFGFNKNEKVLCSIFDKALPFIDTEGINYNWTTRIYDYEEEITGERVGQLAVVAAVLFISLVILITVSAKNYQAAELYKNRMQTFSAMYKSLPGFVYSKDTSGVYTSCNAIFADFLGLPESEIIGKSVVDVYSRDPKLADELNQMDMKVMRENTAMKKECWLTFQDGVSRYFENYKVPLFRNGTVIGLLGLANDVTSHMEMEKAAYEASRAKSNFLARMSHEIRTPMNAIMGMTELALREKDIAAAGKHMITVKQAGAHLLSIINDILDFSKIEVGKLEIVAEDYYFSSLANDVISIIRMRLIDSQIRFAVNIDCNIPHILLGDETRLRQVLLNLLSNAVKYTEKGFVSFTVTFENTGEDTVNLIMEVMDSGRGIKKEDVDTLFDEYVQLNAEQNRGIEGTGLGLTITKSIVEMMKGDIKVYSEYGKGSIFTVTLPQKIRSRRPLAAVDVPEEKSVIVYERREIYANSIVSTIDNLGVSCTLVSSDTDLAETMRSREYTYLFISYPLLERNKKTIKAWGANTRVVILVEFGEAVADKNLRLVAMPVYSISVANILNGAYESLSYRENEEGIIRFTAPEAAVLVVDDIGTNLKVAEGLLLPYRMRLDFCKSGREAIGALELRRYDLIFMDHKMPDMDGIETTRYIRNMGVSDPYYEHLPIVALTANAVSGTREEFLKKGFDDFLSKPIDTIKLNAILEKWIPKEKKRIAVKDDAGYPDEEENNDTCPIEIDGLDSARGIFLSGGDEGQFWETLSVFYRDAITKLTEIRSLIGKGNFELFTIHIHALKSASANIGAGELSVSAQLLENAGTREDSAYIMSHTPGFLIALEQLLININSALTQNRESAREETNFRDAEAVKQELAKLETALENFDAGIINESVQRLLKATTADDAIGDDVVSISDMILLGEFHEAAGIIKRILMKLETEGSAHGEN